MKKTNNYKEFSEVYVRSQLSNKGEHSFKIKGTYLDELAHNTKDHNGSELGVIITNEKVLIGNDTHPMDWKLLNSKYIGFKKSSHNPNTTGFWGVGGSKKFVYKHGILDYHCSIEAGKYLYREFTYIDSNGQKIKDESFESINNTVSGFKLQEYEVSKEKYEELTFSDNFNKPPTWFMSITRYTDCTIGMLHSPTQIIKYLNSSFMNVVNFQAWMKMGLNGKKHTTKKVYYPTVITNGDKHSVPTHYSDLKKIKGNWEIIPNVFVDIYHYKRLTEEKDGIKWVELKSQTNNANDIYYVNHRGGRLQNPRHLWINQQDVILANIDVHSDISTDKAFYGNFIIKLVQGQLEYNTMKTSGINDELHDKVVAFHKDWLNSNTNQHYSSKKGEDNKADDIVNTLLSDKDSQHKTNLESSIRFLSNKQIDEDILCEQKYFSVRENHEDRECDLIILNESFVKKIHFEFQNDKEDWKHIDGFCTRSQVEIAEVNVLVVDSLSNKTKKREYAKKALDKAGIKNTWFVTYSDLLKARKNSFLKIT